MKHIRKLQWVLKALSWSDFLDLRSEPEKWFPPKLLDKRALLHILQNLRSPVGFGVKVVLTQKGERHLYHLPERDMPDPPLNEMPFEEPSMDNRLAMDNILEHMLTSLVQKKGFLLNVVWTEEGIYIFENRPFTKSRLARREYLFEIEVPFSRRHRYLTYLDFIEDWIWSIDNQYNQFEQLRGELRWTDLVEWIRLILCVIDLILEIIEDFPEIEELRAISILINKIALDLIEILNNRPSRAETDILRIDGSRYFTQEIARYYEMVERFRHRVIALVKSYDDKIL